jgi:aminopeptidase N
MKAPDILGRIYAAKELAQTGRRTNIEAITAAYRNEPFWGVRCEMATALGKANSEAALEGLVALLAFEQQPLVMPDLLKAAGNYRDPRIVIAIMTRLDGGLGYEATQAAYEALGAQRDGAPFTLLATAAGKPGFNGIAQVGALRGLAATRQREAFEPLLARVAYGATSSYARPAAVAALAAFGKYAEKREREAIVERLVDLLRDPVYQVAVAAVRGLGVMQANEAIPQLEAFARARVVQEAAVAERVIESLRRSGQPGEPALDKQIDILNDRIRKLEDQVQRLA